MSSRVNLFKTIPALAETLADASMALGKISLDKKLKHLVDIRASQLNHCAFCLDMHVKEAKMHGERELRLYHVAIWRESPLFSAKEKAALALTEALTRIGDNGVSEALYNELREHFSEVEVSELTFTIAVINAWNRLQILSQMEYSTINRNFINSAHQDGKEVYVWTINDSDAMSRMMFYGVDGIITDEMGLLNESVKQTDEEITYSDKLLNFVLGVG